MSDIQYPDWNQFMPPGGAGTAPPATSTTPGYAPPGPKPAIVPGSVQAQQAATQGAAATNPAAQFNPLAMQLFFTQGIAPLLQQIAGMNQGATNQFMNNIPGTMHGLPMPANANSILSGMLGANNNMQQALAGASVAAPALDQLMAGISADLSQQLKAYQEAQLANLKADSSLAAGGSGNADVDAVLAAAAGKTPSAQPKTGG